MANLFSSSIGKKLIMSISGLFLILFLLFHMSMNLVALISEEGYNIVCEFLGANWYALIATMILAAGAIIHILYAFVLYFNNRKARGNDAYAVTAKPKEVEWASQNMLALGITMAAFLVLHLYHFWSKMQLVEIKEKLGMDVCHNAVEKATDGIYWIQQTFQNPINVALYIVALVALWFHLTHGFWSALQTLGWNNLIWIKRLQTISNIVATIICLGFAAVVLVFYLAHVIA
ncbi:MAG: succinate dehydrogenase/fumarate reductase cytochrome b subunit [Bacteroidales bacterium]|jgi:succinate dehydrogenase / fumarate reductase cytochrome b subunit|nr:succinate dehydrogenase/fumarate reductase cytochrome b subunit [Bacteroidales bacterium]